MNSKQRKQHLRRHQRVAKFWLELTERMCDELDSGDLTTKDIRAIFPEIRHDFVLASKTNNSKEQQSCN